MSATKGVSKDVAKQIEYLARALKAPRIRDAAGRLGDQARDAGWSHEEYLAAVLDREVSARDASGARLRIRAAGFGTAKTIEDFVFDHQPGLKRAPSPTWRPGRSWPRPRTSCCSGHPGPARRIVRLTAGSSSHGRHRCRASVRPG